MNKVFCLLNGGNFPEIVLTLFTVAKKSNIGNVVNNEIDKGRYFFMMGAGNMTPGEINFDAFYLKFYEVNGMDREEFKKHGFEEWEKMDAGMKESFEAGAAAVLAAHLEKDF